MVLNSRAGGLWLFGLLACLSGSSALGDQPTGDNIVLFNGRDLSGWHGMESMDPRELLALSDEERAKLEQQFADDLHQHWRVEQGVIVNDGRGPYLTTNEDYDDYELWIDFQIRPKGDSGIYLRATPQVQIWDFTEAAGYWKLGADKGSGGLWNNSPDSPGRDPAQRADNPVGQWNRFRIRQVGEQTSVWLNDQLVVDRARMENYWDRDLPIARRGPIQLQTHGGETRWRNIAIRAIPPTEANTLLRAEEPDDVLVLFDGRSLESWSGAVDSYHVRDGALMCRAGTGGNLYTEDVYDDFIARLEFKLPPAGNNGLAIRYPGDGNAAYQGMCELQVLDSEHPKYASLDPRQYHGSAYGMVAAARGYLRPTGQWNYQQVTVTGSRVKVELNGFTILDADLSQVTDFMGDTPHPGKDRKQGHFGFAGHGDPVAFRGITIEPLTAP